MIAALPIVLGVIVGLAAGGSVRALRELQPPRWAAVAVCLFVVQSIARQGHLGSALAITIWAVCGVTLTLVLLARPSPSLRICAAGIALNTFVVVVNGGMPFVVPGFWPNQWAELLEVGSAGFYAAAGAGSSFALLGDVVPTPVPSLVSAGDILLAVGICAYLSRSVLVESASCTLASKRETD